MTREASRIEPVKANGSPGIGFLDRRPGVPRRRFVGLVFVTVSAGIGGCLGRDSDRGTTTSVLGSRQVTTTAGDGVEVLGAQIVIRDDAVGPRVSYRLRNVDDDDATIALRTVLGVDGGGTYEATTRVDVPAGDEVVVGYPLATWDELGEADAGRVRRHESRFDVYVNGDHRPGA